MTKLWWYLLFVKRNDRADQKKSKNSVFSFYKTDFGVRAGQRCHCVSLRWRSEGIHQRHTFIPGAGQSVKLNGIVTAHFPDVLTGPYANFNGYEKTAMCTKTPNKELSLSTLI